MTISWAGGNDYSVGTVGEEHRFYIERHGKNWEALDFEKTSASNPVATGLTMRDAQMEVERQFEAV